MLNISLRERGAPKVISRSDWDRLHLERTVPELERAGVLSVDRSDDGVLLTPSAFVGKWQAPEVSLEITPKDPDLVSMITRLAVDFASREATEFKLEFEDATGSKTVGRFATLLRRCSEDGFPWEYKRSILSGTNVRGKPLFRESISSYLSKGINHKLVTAYADRQPVWDFNETVWAAYRKVMASEVELSPLLNELSTLMELLQFRESFDIDQTIAKGTALLTNGSVLSSAHQRMVRYCLAILSQERLVGADVTPVSFGKAHFRNLERIWELAVASMASEFFRSETMSVKLHGLANAKLRLFTDGGPTIDPDVVVRDGAEIRCLLDAKYKLHSMHQAGFASDIYQMTSYLSRTGASIGALVYVGSKASVTRVGTTANGAYLLAITISASAIAKSGVATLSSLITETGFSDIIPISDFAMA